MAIFQRKTTLIAVVSERMRVVEARLDVVRNEIDQVLAEVRRIRAQLSEPGTTQSEEQKPTENG